MSLGGLKKQLNKTSQLLSEKVGGVKGTELNEEFVSSEKLVLSYDKMLEEVVQRSNEYIRVQRGFSFLPGSGNAGSSSNSGTLKTGSESSSGGADHGNSLEARLGQCLHKHGSHLGQDTIMGPSLVSSGEAFFQLADERKSLELSCRQNFSEPLNSARDRDLKQINFHLKKVESRRLDFDFKKRKGAKCPPEELREADEKFRESLVESQQAMNSFFESDAEHLQALLSFVTSNKQYHENAVNILGKLEDKLRSNLNEPRAAHSRTKSAKPIGFAPAVIGEDPWSNNPTSNVAAVPLPTVPTFTVKPRNEETNLSRVPTCRVLYDFPAENEGELDLKEGDIVKLMEKVDENWFYGEIGTRKGHFPQSYVEVLVPL